MSDLQKAKEIRKKIYDELTLAHDIEGHTYIMANAYELHIKELEKTIGEMDGVLIDDFKAMFDIWDNGTSGEREDTLEIMIDKSQEILEKYHGKPIEEIIKS